MIDIAIEQCQIAQESLKKHRKQTTISESLLNMFSKTDYESYTDSKFMIFDFFFVQSYTI